MTFRKIIVQSNYSQLNKLVTLNKGVSKYFSSKMARFHQLYAGKALPFLVMARRDFFVGN